MPTPFILAAALAAAAAAPAPPPETPPGEAAPLLVAHADGSWTITREIREEPPMLEIASDFLLVDWTGADDRDAMRAGEEERQADEAFEEAIEAARRDERPE
jgi:hypothetical protein